MQQPFQRKAPKLVLSFKAKKLPWQLFLVKGGIVFFKQEIILWRHTSPQGVKGGESSEAK